MIAEGFQPGLTLREGIGELISWVKTQQAEENFEAARRELLDKGLDQDVGRQVVRTAQREGGKGQAREPTGAVKEGKGQGPKTGHA